MMCCDDVSVNGFRFLCRHCFSCYDYEFGAIWRPAQDLNVDHSLTDLFILSDDPMSLRIEFHRMITIIEVLYTQQNNKPMWQGLSSVFCFQKVKKPGCENAREREVVSRSFVMARLRKEGVMRNGFLNLSTPLLLSADSVILMFQFMFTSILELIWCISNSKALITRMKEIWNLGN